MAPLDERALLELWERALPLPAPAREALFSDCSGEGEAPTVGAQRLRVLALHRQVSGDTLPLRCNCPACGEDLGFTVDLAARSASLPSSASTGPHEIAVEGRTLRFRLPSPADVRAADAPDAERFVAQLLARCLLANDDTTAVPTLSPQAVQALGERMEALDPAATLAFAVDCPACACHWDAAFDPARSLWAFLQARAERAMLDVDMLARRYGWNEAEVLALSPTRRRAYLQLAESDPRP